MSKAILDRLAKQFADDIVETHSQCGNDTAVVKREGLVAIATWLRDDPECEFNLYRDVTAVDRLGFGETPRFEVVVHLYSIPRRHSVRLKVRLDEDDLTLPSLCHLWPAATWGERETWDMYGVRFEGHPDLRRILLYEEFEGYPLRKDYDKRKSQPRLDLAAPERDAIAEYRRWESDKKAKSP